MAARVLITGGAGYVGSHVVKILGERGYEIITYDNLSTGNKWAVVYGHLIRADLSIKDTLRKVFEEYNPEAVIHLAAYIWVPESIQEPLKYYRNNVINSINILEVMNEFKVNKFIFSSSAAVYGIPNKIPVPESSPLNPINPYGETKATVERILRDISNSNKCFKYVSLRYFNVAGADPEGQIGFAYPNPTHLIIRALKVAIGESESLKIYGTDYPTPDGTCIRDYIHVSDLAEVHLIALRYLLDGGESDVFNVGYGKGYSVRQVISSVESVTGKKLNIVKAQKRKGDPPVLIADSTKLRSKLGWKPKYDDLDFIIETAWKWEKKLITRGK